MSKQIYLCQAVNCHKEFYLHANCKGIYCSRKCQLNSRQHEKIRKREDYKLNPKICNNCNLPHDYEHRKNKYCSSSCGAIASNKTKPKRSSESRKKYSDYMKSTGRTPPGYIKHGKYSTKIPKICSVCNSTFLSKTRTTCSSVCLRAARVKSGQNSAKVRTIRSKDEKELFNLLSMYTRYHVDANKVIMDGWDIDISIPELKIAIMWNGPWHYKEMKGLNHSLKQVHNRDLIKRRLFKSNGWKVLIFEDRYWSPQLAFSAMVTHLGIEPSKINL